MPQIDPKTVTANEAGITRVYRLDLPDGDVDAFQEMVFDDDGNHTWPMIDALGATSLDADYVDIFNVAALSGVGLSKFLQDGNGISEDDLAPYAEMFATFEGTVMIVYSQAFGAHAQVLNPQAPLRFLAAFREDKPDVNFETLPDGGTKGAVEDPPAKKKPSDAAMGGRVATVALLVMALLVWVMIKIAG